MNDKRFGYQGQFAEKDAETGYNQFELRLYDGRTGRWMNTDPYGQYWSLYLGMGNNPVSYIDRDGGIGEKLRARIAAWRKKGQFGQSPNGDWIAVWGKFGDESFTVSNFGHTNWGSFGTEIKGGATLVSEFINGFGAAVKLSKEHYDNFIGNINVDLFLAMKVPGILSTVYNKLVKSFQLGVKAYKEAEKIDLNITNNSETVLNPNSGVNQNNPHGKDLPKNAFIKDCDGLIQIDKNGNMGKYYKGDTLLLDSIQNSWKTGYIKWCNIQNRSRK
ncbi:MAG: hypothetical protein GXO84_10130 [Chlorobi bacterium]|nr:hypothetical protein [Chlorobiota bacterium]